MGAARRCDAIGTTALRSITIKLAERPPRRSGLPKNVEFQRFDCQRKFLHDVIVMKEGNFSCAFVKPDDVAPIRSSVLAVI